MHALRSTLAVALVLVCAGCDFKVLVPDETSHPEGARLVDGPIRVTLTVTPEVLVPPGTVLAKLTYENLGSETVVLTSSFGCLSFASVYRDGERIPFPSTQYGCTTVVTHRELEPGAPLTAQWPLVVGGEDGLDVPAGTYRFVARLNTNAEDLERTFVIR